MKTLFTFLVLIFFFTNAQAQNIDATLGGNTSAEGFSVKNNGGTTLLRVGGDGNVGIGTTSPDEKLQIGTNSSPGDKYIVIKTSGGNQYRTGLKLKVFADDLGFTIENDERGGSNGLNILRHSGSINGETALFIEKQNGNVGIGTTTPDAKLSFGTDVTDNKIHLYGGPSDKYGFGIRSSQLMIYSGMLGVTTFGNFDGTTYSEHMRVNSSGNVGIGYTDPLSKLSVRSDNSQFFAATITHASGGAGLQINVANMSTSYALNIRQQGSVSIFNVEANGDVNGKYGNYHVASDKRLKKDIVTIPDALDKVMNLRGVNFKWKDPEKDQSLQMGLIAQEVEMIVPEVVHTADDEMQTKAVEYEYLVGLLVEAVKEQQKQIEVLESKINLIALKELDGESFGYIKTNSNNLKNYYSVKR